MTSQEAKKNISILLEIVEPERSKKISEFQKFITKDPSIEEMDNDLYDILLDLAWDLDFYEPNPEWRKECNLDGEEKLIENIKEALQAIEALEMKNPNVQNKKD